MDDRTLLELAAKAAGVATTYWNDGQEPYSSGKGFILPTNRLWNPLTNDGDALRLGVKLNLWEAIRTAHRLITNNVDIYEATRRAIVRAAAAIGKEM